MNGRTISIRSVNGARFNGYLSLPAAHRGPGLLVFHEIFGVNAHIRSIADSWAAEGYVALAPDMFWRVEPGLELDYTAKGVHKGLAIRQKLDFDLIVNDITASLNALRARPECTGKAGAIGYSFGGLLAFLAAAETDIDASIAYYGGRIDRHLSLAKSIRCPIMFHWAAKDRGIPAAAREKVRTALVSHDNAEFYLYPDASHGFNCDARTSFHPSAAQLARSRSIGMLRHTLGPRIDLSVLWDSHCNLEFSARDAAATMTTMVPDPYVNHIPTLTGGYGRRELHRFYQHHFIATLPDDARIVPISRTIGPDRLVDEFILSFTHTTEMDFLLPGLKPTGKRVRIPTVAIVEFRGDKLANEHIYWDQASVLAQIGVLDSTGLPISGVEQADKLAGKEIPSNSMIRSLKPRRSRASA